jgi:tetratricopeptide (TPR) repeat protein
MRCIVISSVLAAASIACPQDKKQGPLPSGDRREGPSTSEPDFVFIKTTSQSIAIPNLNAQISGGEKRLLKRPNDLSLLKTLIDLYLYRVRFLGDVTDYDRAMVLATEPFREDNSPQPSRAFLNRSVLRAALHQFEGALADLDLAQMAGTSTKSLSRRRRMIALAQGDRDPVLNAYAHRPDSEFGFRELTELAAAKMSAGEFDSADALFVRALNVYSGVSPFLVAWVYFERGRMWAEEANNGALGQKMYAVALQHLPSYVTANVHMAELEANSGAVDDAIARLLSVNRANVDPEVPALLSELYEKKGQKAQASSYLKQALALYELLLKRYPAAFYDHATEFYLGPGGDSKRALVLALANLKNRPTERAYRLVMDASFEAKDWATACKTARMIENRASRSVAFLNSRTRALQRCKLPKETRR